VVREAQDGVAMNQLASKCQRLESKIAILQKQPDSLDHYLPETNPYLMEQMDAQQVLLKQLEVQQHFAVIDSSAGALSPCGALESN
jgi:hypothetical protein